MKQNYENKPQPLLVGINRISRLLGVSKIRAREVLFALGVSPVPGVGATGREKYSYPQILNRLENVNDPEVRRSRAFRQPEMKKIFN